MYKKIIVGLSLEHGIASKALEAASVLADKGAEIHAIHVTEPLQGSVRSYVSEEDVAKAVEATREDLKKRVASYPGVETKVLEGNPGRVLTEYAKKVGGDCIVVASHKPGLRDFLLGSTAARVVRHAECTVHVLR
jgi:nucleotide-binding universal stress UspA family protein